MAASTARFGCFCSPGDYANFKFPPNSRHNQQLWSSCDLREFNVAYDVGEEPLAFNEGFSVETLTRMSDLKISFRVTLYAEPDDER